MTILCITTTGVPGVRRCTEYGEHQIVCADHPGYRERPGTCRGCLPKKADRGFLCESCYEAVESAYSRYDDFVTALREAGGRVTAPSADGIRGSKPGGYSNLSLAFLEIDACSRHLASFAGHRTLEQWVSTEDGARDAVQFAHAAQNAYRALEIEERPREFVRLRCPGCARLTLTRNPTREVGGQTVVECKHCGHVLDKVRRPVDRWSGSSTCADGAHLSCSRYQCACECHELGRGRVGPTAVFSGDEHATNPDLREHWTITDAHTITFTFTTRERTAA